MKNNLTLLLHIFFALAPVSFAHAQAALRAEGAATRIVCNGSPFIVLNNVGYTNNASSSLFSAANSEVIFTGNTSVNVSSSGGYSTQFYNLEINKTGGSEIDVISNNVELRVSNNLEMVSGNVDMNSNLGSTLTLGINTSTIGTLIRTSGHVYNGYFKRFYNTVGASDVASWDIPIGMNSTNYNMARVWYPSGVSSGGSLRARFVATNPMYNGLPLTDVSNTSCSVSGQIIDNLANEGYWEINPGDGWTPAQTDLYNIRLNYSGITTVSNPNCLSIVKSEDHLAWMLEGTHGGVTAPTVRRNGLSGWSWFTIGSEFDVNPLPVELVKFIVSCTDNKTMLVEWATASETNNASFTLERSKNAADWEHVTTIAGAGNSNQYLSYQYEDAVFNSGYYYRLFQTDINGDQTSYGPVYKYCTDRENTMDIVNAWQNSNGGLNVIMNFPADMAYTLDVFDMTGKKLDVLKSHATAGLNQATLETITLRSAVYLISLTGNDQTITRKILVTQTY